MGSLQAQKISRKTNTVIYMLVLQIAKYNANAQFSKMLQIPNE